MFIKHFDKYIYVRVRMALPSCTIYFIYVYLGGLWTSVYTFVYDIYASYEYKLDYIYISKYDVTLLLNEFVHNAMYNTNISYIQTVHYK